MLLLPVVRARREPGLTQQNPNFPSAAGSGQLGVALKHPIPLGAPCPGKAAEERGCWAEPGLNPEEGCVVLEAREGAHVPPRLSRAGEEEDGDEDDEAEGATGKRAAEDDEVGRAAPPSPLRPEWVLGRHQRGRRRPGWVPGSGSCPSTSCCVPLGDAAQFHLYAGLVSQVLAVVAWSPAHPGFGAPALWRGTGQGRSGPRASCEKLPAAGNASGVPPCPCISRGTRNPSARPGVAPSPNGFPFPLRTTTSIPRSRKPTKMTRQQIIIIFF